ncbi:MAG: substrate-binding domain-containing protein [Prevotella sp.]|nr:substrate-binding domain-containing protein [Prevotella sp.]
MARVILLTDFGEEYAKKLMEGIVEFSRKTEPWVLCKMPLSYRDLYGIAGVLKWAKEWKADAIIGQFYNTDKVELFAENNILAIAQDFKNRFKTIPNITGNHIKAGKIGAQHFIDKGYDNYAFLGLKEVIWSEERCQGFKMKLEEAGKGLNYYEYQRESKEGLWYYEEGLKLWLENLPKPIAIMACDDNQAHHIAVICNLQNIKIPDEISLLGVDNDEAICSLSDPSLSSLNQAVAKGGYEIAAKIERFIKDRSYKCTDIIIEPTYITARESTNIFSTNNPYISTVLKYIHQNIHQKLTVRKLLELVPLSRRLLEINFRDATGESIYSYILRLRIEQFTAQLVETDKPIINIALELGYLDYKNISRLFKKFKGCTPSEYRTSADFLRN